MAFNLDEEGPWRLWEPAGVGDSSAPLHMMKM